MEKAVEISRNFGYIKIPDSSIIPATDLKKYKAGEILILCTGSQGEPNAALSRIAGGDHKDIHVMPGDTVVFSSSAIPGNGIMIAHIVNLLTRCGAECITNSILADIHSSGHPSKQELRLILKLVQPKYFMPMHGEYRMLRLHAELACSLGMKADNCFVLENGDTLILAKHKVQKGYQVEHGITYIDGKDINGLADSVMTDRRVLTNDGMMIIAISIDTKNNTLMMDPILYNRGVIQSSNTKALEECRQLVKNAIVEKLASKTNFSELKVIIKNVAGNFINARTNRKPMIIPIIMNKN
jgi:ribonuclease J